MVQELRLCNCCMYTIPDWVAQQQNLRNLFIWDSSHGTLELDGFRHLLPLKQLQHLEICECRMIEVSHTPPFQALTRVQHHYGDSIYRMFDHTI